MFAGYSANFLVTWLVSVLVVCGGFVVLFFVCFCFQHDVCGHLGQGTLLSVKSYFIADFVCFGLFVTASVTILCITQ